MPTRFRHAALVGKYQALGIRSVLEEVADFLIRSGLEVSLERDTARNTGITDHPALDLATLGRTCDLAVVVGGDGTMLSIARELARYQTPLVGINQGRLGFITDIPLSEMRETLTPMIAGDYEEEHRSMLAGEVLRDGACIFAADALNDVVVSRGATPSMVEFSVTVQSQFVANIRADGLIVASPTGSTAYSLSAGGPVLHPAISGWLLLPIAPHTLSNRPIVLPDAGDVSVELVAGRELSVSFDSQSLASLMRGDRVVIRRSDHRARFLHPRGWSYYATLRKKLHWNEGGVG
jgi:NAD+ kinase